MGLRGPKISENSKKIVRLVKLGYSARKISNKGFPLPTARYWHDKINRPEKFTQKLNRVKVLNKIRYDKTKRELSTAPIS